MITEGYSIFNLNIGKSGWIRQKGLVKGMWWLILCVNLTGSQDAQMFGCVFVKMFLDKFITFKSLNWVKLMALPNVDGLVWSVEGLNETKGWLFPNKRERLLSGCLWIKWGIGCSWVSSLMVFGIIYHPFSWVSRLADYKSWNLSASIITWANFL